ncbi:uncharacterized protein DUF4287 [Isoptericola sp. CG 20/1183]|uniref:Uncharacterized protein DUF4287 n=1 Tax=Isoptericola halotolerans TaxID=300560 RepID=A0ABX5EDC2_9MICO|nr:MULTISPECIES: DUF4287 domain-containing protein [Isoptericola]PRZ03810.1 uncharacterized protein DUF4287 [Isoptericola sp. CG 20/1183]PRZ04057.1 uncharacterized protein DUF4287 [Isoptericola halotolerans]
MTSHESFKRQVRERMARTGERYAAARRSLLPDNPPSGAAPGWVSRPETSDATIKENTGHGWDEWVSIVDDGPGRSAGHTEIAAWVAAHHDVSGWWAQTVTVGYERITGIRLPGQMPDGTFTVSRSKVLGLDHDTAHALLLDDADRAALVPGLSLSPRSRPGVKRPRFAVAETGALDPAEHGVLMVSTDPVGGRTRMTLTHERLASPAAAEHWRGFWGEWLTALAGSEVTAR